MKPKKSKSPVARSNDDRLIRKDEAEESRAATTFCLAREFSGLLPSPEVLRGYAEISPEIATTIVEMARNEQTLREKALDATIAENRRDQELAGQGLKGALFILFLAILAGYFCAYVGSEWGAVAAFGMGGSICWMRTGRSRSASSSS